MTLDKVDNGLYVGDAESLDDRHKIRNKDIDVVVNVSGYQPDYKFITDSEFMYMHIPMADGNDAKYSEFTAAVSGPRHGHSLWGLDVLVSCAAGMSRSVAVAAAIVAKTREIKYEDALDRVMEARNIASRPHPQLVQYGKGVCGEAQPQFYRNIRDRVQGDDE